MIKKKIAKVMMVMFMILGILFSIANYVSIEIKGADGGAKDGDWEYNQFGEKECYRPGTKCDPTKQEV